MAIEAGFPRPSGQQMIRRAFTGEQLPRALRGDGKTPFCDPLIEPRLRTARGGGGGGVGTPTPPGAMFCD